MEAVWIAALIVLVLILLVIAIALVALAGIWLFAFLPLAVGLPLGIWVNQYSTALGVAIILTSVMAQVGWAIFLKVRWP